MLFLMFEIFSLIHKMLIKNKKKGIKAPTVSASSLIKKKKFMNVESYINLIYTAHFFAIKNEQE